MSKGKRRERQAAELYQQAGYATYRPQESQWGETDMYGLFDMLAIGHGETRLVQVKATSSRVPYTGWFDSVEKWVTESGIRPPYSMYHDFLICYDNEGWRLIGETQEGPETLVDERDSTDKMGKGVVEWLQE